jgi:hypothetical protein
MQNIQGLKNQMKTFSQFITEAKETKPKGPPKTMHLEYPHISDVENHKGIKTTVLHVKGGNIPKGTEKHFKETLKNVMGQISKPPMQAQERGGAWLSGDNASFFEHERISPGDVKKHTVAAGDKNATHVSIVRQGGKTGVRVHGNEPLTPEREQHILNHPGLNAALGTGFEIIKD